MTGEYFVMGQLNIRLSDERNFAIICFGLIIHTL